MQHPLTLGAILVMVACAALLIWWVTDANTAVRENRSKGYLLSNPERKSIISRHEPEALSLPS